MERISPLEAGAHEVPFDENVVSTRLPQPSAGNLPDCRRRRYSHRTMQSPLRVRARRAQRPRFLGELCRRLVARGAQKIYLFGSYARGEADADSDVDLVVIQETSQPFLERVRTAVACVEPGWPVDLLVYTPTEFETMVQQGNAFAELVTEEGIPLHGGS
jgi:predicted nucleotidyltransferase